MFSGVSVGVHTAGPVDVVFVQPDSATVRTDRGRVRGRKTNDIILLGFFPVRRNIES